MGEDRIRPRRNGDKERIRPQGVRGFAWGDHRVDPARDRSESPGAGVVAEPGGHGGSAYFGAQGLIVAIRGPSSGLAALLRNNGDGTFAAPTFVFVGAQPRAVTAADVDVAACSDRLLPATIVRDNGAGTFMSPVALPVGGQPDAILAEDVDGDGALDLVAGSAAEPVTVFGNLAPWLDSDADGTPDCADLCPGFDDGTDLDGNGVPDGCDVAPCPADLSGDGHVGGDDLGALLGAWGACAACAADINGDGTVDAADLGQLLAAWGDCGGG